MKQMLCVLVLMFILWPAKLRAADLLVDHVEYIRKAGEAQQMSIFFPGCDPQGTYNLAVTNGQDDSHRATSGSVTVNGVEVVTAADFARSPAPAVITKSISGVGERNTLTLSVTAPQGSVIGWRVTAEVNCLEISITSPVAGFVFNQGEITVRGKVRHRTPEVGVIVNGVLAEIHGNDWVVNGVKLVAGGNTLTAAVIFEDGSTAESSIIVTNQDPGAPAIVLDAVVGSGIAPLTVVIRVENHTQKPLVNFKVDYEDDGRADLELPSLESFEHEYPQDGLFTASVMARDEQGVEYTGSFAVNVHPMPPLKSKWEKMKAALAARDIEGAVKYFEDHEKQREMFTFIDQQSQNHPERPSLPQIAAEMQTIELISLRGGTAEYRIRRDEPVDGVPTPISYHLYFSKGMNGLWNLKRF